MISGNSQKTKITALIIASFTIAVFIPALQNGFVNWDDGIFIYENPNLQSIDAAFFKWIFTTFHTADWFPLTWISYAADYALWGLNPMGYHLTSILFHGLNTFIVVLLAIRLTEYARHNRTAPRPAADSGKERDAAIIAGAVTGLLFGLHPLHVESVVWASERKDVLYSFFYLLSIMSYLRYASFAMRRPPASPTVKEERRSYIFSLIFCTLSLMSKSMAVTLPVVLVILDFYPLQRFHFAPVTAPRKKRSLSAWFASHSGALMEKLPFIALSFAVSIIAIIANKAEGAVVHSQMVFLANRILVAFRSICFYLFKIIWPTDLAPLYVYPMNISLFTIEYTGVTIIVLGITVFCITQWKKRKVWAAAWAYFIVVLLPVLGIVQSGVQAAADRYTYLSSLGPFLLTGLGAKLLYERSARDKSRNRIFKSSVIVSAGIIICLLSVLTIKQSGIWKDSITLWNHQIRIYPDSYTAYKNLADAYARVGKINDSIKSLNRALQINSKDPAIYYNRGIGYGKAGQHQKAVEDFKKAIELGHPEAKYYNELGVAQGSLGNYQQAIESLDAAIRLDPQFASAYFYRGLAYKSLNMQQDAIRDFQSAARLGHKNAQAYLRTLGMNW